MSYMSTITGKADTVASPVSNAKSGFGALDQTDFLRLLTTQMQQQDPFAPMDNKEMLAQMAQFSSLGAANDMSATLKDIATKLDAVLAAQATAATTTPTT